MTTFQLVQSITPDQLNHQGLFSKPVQSTKRAVLWVHGLTGAFYSSIDLINTLADHCAKNGMAFASFNTRGHDSITGIKKIDTTSEKGYTHVNGGAGYEVFSECIYDIQGSLDFLEKEGMTEVILVGHSTGANKVSYFSATVKDPRVIGVILLSAVSDKLAPEINKEQLSKDIEMMQTLVNSNKGDGLVIGKTFFPLTPKRFLSLFTPGIEDQFDYGETNPSLKIFSSIEMPVLVMLGDQDEYLDRKAEVVLSIFKRFTTSKQYHQTLISQANHGFKGKENEVSTTIMDWIKSL